MTEYRDQNDRDVAALLEAYDELVRRVEAYLSSLDWQHAAATAAGEAKYARHIDTGRRQARGLLDLLENDVLDGVINLRNNQHHIRMAREGKLV